MSFVVPLSVLDNEWKRYIRKTCNISGKITKWNMYDPPRVCVFKIEEINNSKHVVLPLYMWRDIFDTFPSNIEIVPESPFSKREIFVQKLDTAKDRDQSNVIKIAKANLLSTRTVFLALRTGFGKTACAIYLLEFLRHILPRKKNKIVVLCHINTLHSQWVDELLKFTPSLKVQIVKTKKKSYGDNHLDPNADVYIMGIQKSINIDSQEYSKIGVVIVDEVHKTLTQTFSTALLRFRPEFLIGLSATPDRSDGMHSILYPYFGPLDSFIVRKQVKNNFRIVKYLTKYKPEIRYTPQGVDWTRIISSLAENEERQHEIADVLRSYYEDEEKSWKMIVMTTRVCEAIGCERHSTECKCELKTQGVGPILSELDCDVGYKAWKISENVDARILVGTAQKIGTGFNDPSRNMLALIDDVRDVRQFEGRVRVDDNLLIDFVDNYSTFEKHSNMRDKWYLEKGGKIEIVDKRK